MITEISKTTYAKCSLVKVKIKGNRISFIFNSPELKKSPMRTVSIVNSSLGIKSLFDQIIEVLIGRTIDIFDINDHESLSSLILDETKGKVFLLETQSSKCGKYTDILSIKEAS